MMMIVEVVFTTKQRTQLLSKLQLVTPPSPKITHMLSHGVMVVCIALRSG